MASSMIHYIIANKIMKEYKVDNENRFLLGATLAPDASSHEDGSYNIAHFLNLKGDRKGIDWWLFEKKYGDKILPDSFYLGYWCHLIQDAIWFHDIVNKFVRIYEGEAKKACYEKGYRDYTRLNYLLRQEYEVNFPQFVLDIPAVDEISIPLLDELYLNFKNHFSSPVCRHTELEIYKWDIITEFIDFTTQFCIREIEALRNGNTRVEPERNFVIK